MPLSVRMAACALMALAVAGRAAAGPASTGSPPQAANQQARATVELETLASLDSLRVAQDLGGLFDDGTTRRLVTVLGTTAIQNYWDLAYMRGVDLAILPTNINDIVQSLSGPGAGAQTTNFGYTYVTKLGSEELHIIAQTSIKTLDDLKNQKVAVDLPGSSPGTVAAQMSKLLGFPITPVNVSQEQGLESLRKRDVAAMMFFAEKPSLLALTIGRDEGLHLLPMPINSVLIKSFAHASLSASDYPDLMAPNQTVDTISVGMVLAAAKLPANSARYHNLQSFVDLLFTQFSSLRGPGHDPMWRQVDLAAELPGWQRFPPAQQWLDRNAAGAQAVKAATPDTMEAMFSRFLDTRARLTGEPPLTEQQKQSLFDQFRHWQSTGTN